MSSKSNYCELHCIKFPLKSATLINIYRIGQKTEKIWKSKEHVMRRNLYLPGLLWARYQIIVSSIISFSHKSPQLLQIYTVQGKRLKNMKQQRTYIMSWGENYICLDWEYTVCITVSYYSFVLQHTPYTDVISAYL